MLPIERQNRIKELVRDKQNIKITDLSELLGVSEMTIHRDIKPLINEGVVMKTFGGISLVREQQPGNHSNVEVCVFCSRKIQDRLAYRLILSNNETEMACCAHCGLLRHRQLGKKVVQAICPDFFKQTTISAPLAWYVVDASVDIGCCKPQVLTFEQKEPADNFVKGFGGQVYTFSEVIEVIFQKMNGGHSCCGKHHQE
ncbi:DeoR family transcriptional regulator [Virgibacillus dakarensis]|uniref:DeoR family transcriptional regulator n=1 Tax=Virgibacillus dakarensis TaxID=1917889 RepID=UPI000B44C6F7|nr:DeoR family transcriptional regulator [Virgibacillus dakarensis]